MLPNQRYVDYFEMALDPYCKSRKDMFDSRLLQTASSFPEIIACMISALSESYGPLFGGAIHVAYKSIETVGFVENVQAKIDSVKAGKERLLGYSHPV